MTSMPVVEYPHLETPVTVLRDFPHLELTDERITIDVDVRRWSSESEPFIYLEERDHGSLLRLREQDAQALMHALAKAILAARVQAEVDLPTVPTHGSAQ